MTLPEAMALAVQEARRAEGRTAPNPAVGAVALDAQGGLLASGFHAQAGQAHAEVACLAALGEARSWDQLHTLVVTLEPCHHQGRTGPCTGALVRARAQAPGFVRVIYGERDPTPEAGGGVQALLEAGFEVEALSTPETERLLAPFKKRVITGLPWVVVKTVLRPEAGGGWTMIPPPGQKTFSQPSSLRLAHTLRRRAGAILTGSGTWLADRPLFTVREVEDFPEGSRPPRQVVVLSRSREAATLELGTARLGRDLGEELARLGREGCLEVLVEAGPSLSGAVQQAGLCDEHVVVTSPGLGSGDAWRVTYREHPQWDREGGL